jgi:hypothetical protein
MSDTEDYDLLPVAAETSAGSSCFDPIVLDESSEGSDCDFDQPGVMKCESPITIDDY